MKTASGSPGSQLPGEPGAGHVADRRLVESGTDALADSPGDSRESEHDRRRQGGRRSFSGRAAEERDDRVETVEERRSHRKCAMIQLR